MATTSDDYDNQQVLYGVAPPDASSSSTDTSDDSSTTPLQDGYLLIDQTN